MSTISIPISAAAFAAAAALSVTLIVVATTGTSFTRDGERDDEEPAGCPAVGNTCSDGTIYAGDSPDTNKPMYALPADAPLTMWWEEATKYAADLEANGHKDWRLPSKAELDVLYRNRDKGALRGTFDESGSLIAGWYWSSTEEFPDIAHDAWMERFSDGYRYWHWKNYDASLRPVRSEKPRGNGTHRELPLP